MDKVTRTLLLFTKLLKGESVNKTLFCLETDSLPRSFDRDIEDIRLYFSETYDHRELIYDRTTKQYRLTEKQVKPLESAEVSLILQLFHDTSLLSGEEFRRFSENLCFNVGNNQEIAILGRVLQENYVKPTHNRSILKMHSDLQKMIAEKWVIRLRYFPENEVSIPCVEVEVEPILVKFEENQLFLSGIKTENGEAEFFPVNWIDSFVMVRKQSDEV